MGSTVYYLQLGLNTTNSTQCELESFVISFLPLTSFAEMMFCAFVNLLFSFNYICRWGHTLFRPLYAFMYNNNMYLNVMCSIQQIKFRIKFYTQTKKVRKGFVDRVLCQCKVLTFAVSLSHHSRSQLHLTHTLQCYARHSVQFSSISRANTRVCVCKNLNFSHLCKNRPQNH